MIALLLAIAIVGAGPLAVRLALRRIGRPVGGGPAGLLAVAALLAAAGLLVERGPIAAALVGPWVVGAAALGLVALATIVRILVEGAWRSSIDRLGTAVALGFLAVGSVWLAADRAGIALLGFDPTIVLLTAVHFHVAGFVLATVGIETAARTNSRAAGLGATGILVGSPMTALGFLGVAVLGTIGAEIVALGGLAIGAGLVRAALIGRGPARVLLGVAGLALFVTMPLAGVYALGTSLAIATLDIPAMAAIHGGLNVVAVAIPATIGWTLPDR